MLAEDANSSITSSGPTEDGTCTVGALVLALLVACPTYVIGDGAPAAEGEVPPRHRRGSRPLEPDDLQVLVAGAPGRSLLLSWQMKTPFGNSGPRFAVDAVTPSVRSQSSELVPFATRKVFTKSLPGLRL